MSTQVQQQVGGVVVRWLLAAPIRDFVSKSNGHTKTVVELRDPAQLRNSIVIFLDGEAGALTKVAPNTLVTLRLDEVRGGRGRGELIGSVGRESIEAAFASVGGSA